MRRDAGAVLLVVAVVAAMRRRPKGGGAQLPYDIGPGWMWPVPDLEVDGARYPATVSSGFGSPRDKGTASEHAHNGLDIMYRRKGLADITRWPPGRKAADGFSDGSKGYFAPMGTPIVAAMAGRVWSVAERSDGGGWSVIVDHGARFTSYYTHLASVDFEIAHAGKRADGGAAQYVTTGQRLGAMGGDKGDSAKLRHLHFELRYWPDGRPWAPQHKSQSVNVWDGGGGPMKEWARTVWSL